MTSVNVGNFEQLVCPRPPHFKPRRLQNEGSIINLLGANASLQTKNLDYKCTQNKSSKSSHNKIQNNNKKQKVSMISFLNKKAQRKIQKKKEKQNLK